MRLGPGDAIALASRFAQTRGKLWRYFTDEIRHALVDAAVMDHVRAAWSADVTKAHTPAEIVEFRGRLVVALALYQNLRLDDGDDNIGALS